VLRELPSALLVALACTQIALCFAVQLSPWKGGGFGMFATNDHGGFRSVRVYALAADGERRIDVPPELQREEVRARELPSARALQRFARRMAPLAAGAEALRVEVWRTEFDAALHPSREKLSEATWRGAP
jgi:hypothetical protein